jgi:hypothetical protein
VLGFQINGSSKFVSHFHLNPCCYCSFLTHLGLPTMTSMSGGGSRPPNFDSNAVAFRSLVSSLGKSIVKSLPAYFVKKLNQIPEVNILSTSPWHIALALAERGLIRKFTGIWPFPRSMELRVQKNRVVLIKGKLTHYLCGRGFYVFLFELKEDQDLIFYIGPCFFDTCEMYLNH